MKKPAFPNEQFKSQEELFKFMDKVKITDMPSLYAKKKEMDRQAKLLEPTIRPTKLTEEQKKDLSERLSNGR